MKNILLVSILALAVVAPATETKHKPKHHPKHMVVRHHKAKHSHGPFYIRKRSTHLQHPIKTPAALKLPTKHH